MRPLDHIDACRASHQRFLAAIAPLTDDDVGSPSLLPGYTRAHLLTHVANKVMAHVWVFEGAAEGEIRRLHPVGHDAAHAAATGASRTATQLHYLELLAVEM